MNTDNMAISGETIDYGPCAFMDAYDPATVFSSIDRDGRYAYGNQPAIAQWNLARLAEALLPLLDADRIVLSNAPTRCWRVFPIPSSNTGWRACAASWGCSGGNRRRMLAGDLLEWMQLDGPISPTRSVR